MCSELGLCTDVQGIIPWPRLPVSAGDGIPMLRAAPCPGVLVRACTGLRVVFLLTKSLLSSPNLFSTLWSHANWPHWGQHLVAQSRCALPFDGSPSQGSRRVQGCFLLTEWLQFQVTQILCTLLCVAFSDVLGDGGCGFFFKEKRHIYAPDLQKSIICSSRHGFSPIGHNVVTCRVWRDGLPGIRPCG